MPSITGTSIHNYNLGWFLHLPEPRFLSCNVGPVAVPAFQNCCASVGYALSPV